MCIILYGVLLDEGDIGNSIKVFSSLIFLYIIEDDNVIELLVLDNL